MEKRLVREVIGVPFDVGTPGAKETDVAINTKPT
jgi:hypothetical protein